MTLTATSAEQYLAAFRDRRACCRALLELSAEQQMLVETEDYTRLVPLLSHKQQLLDALQDRTTLWQSWRADRDHLPGDLRRDCETVLTEAEDLLQQLLSLEAVCTTALSERRELAQQQLRDVNQGSQALAAYQFPSDATVVRRLDCGL